MRLYGDYLYLELTNVSLKKSHIVSNAWQNGKKIRILLFGRNTIIHVLMHARDLYWLLLWLLWKHSSFFYYRDFNHRMTLINELWKETIIVQLTVWRRNYFFLILAHPVYKMWIIREPNKLELWNKLHFEEKKKRRVLTIFKIFSTYICWINI